MALKKGANWGAFGKYSNIVKRGAGAAQTGIGFGAGMAALPEIIKRKQQRSMQEDTGDGQKKKSGMSTLGKVALTAGGLALAAKGGHWAAKQGWLGQSSKTVAQNISKSMDKTKDSVLRKIGANKLADKRLKYNDSQKIAESTTTTKMATPTDKRKGEGVLSTLSSFVGGGSEKTQNLANQFRATDSKYLRKAGDFMKDHRRTALVATAPLAYAGSFGAWEKSEKLTNKAIKKFDPEAYKDEEQ
jgi:hypothetical protein